MGIDDCSGQAPSGGIKFDWTFNLQNLLTAVLVLGGFFAAWNNLVGRVITLEEGARTDKEKNREQDKLAREERKEMLERVKAVDGKVDRLIERHFK